MDTDEHYGILHAVSTGSVPDDLITTLSSLECLRVRTVGRDIIDLKPGSTVVLHATLSNEHGSMEASIWVSWNELAPLMYAAMSQRNWPTQTTSDLVDDILSSAGCQKKVEG